jgi:ornithine--oxo-acid transaminase
VGSEECADVGFDLTSLLDTRRGSGYELHAKYLNPQLPRVLHAIGFDKVYARAEGAYLYDREGNRYLDFLAGFGAAGIGRNHPVVRQALRDVLNTELADLVQLDCALLPGLLAERLLANAPGLDRVYFCNSGTEAVEAALKFARCATGRPRIIYCDHGFHGLTAGSLSVNGAAGSARCCLTRPFPSVISTHWRVSCSGVMSQRCWSSQSRAKACTCHRRASWSPPSNWRESAARC